MSEFDNLEIFNNFLFESRDIFKDERRNDKEEEDAAPRNQNGKKMIIESIGMSYRIEVYVIFVLYFSHFQKTYRNTGRLNTSIYDYFLKHLAQICFDTALK
jgi:hypothetical protein